MSVIVPLELDPTEVSTTPPAELDPTEVFAKPDISPGSKLHTAITLGLSKLVESAARAGEIDASVEYARLLGRYILARREGESSAAAFFAALTGHETAA